MTCDDDSHAFGGKGSRNTNDDEFVGGSLPRMNAKVFSSVDFVSIHSQYATCCITDKSLS